MRNTFKLLPIAFLLACSTTPEKQFKKPTFSEYKESVRKAPESFMIDPSKENLLELKEGTKILFPPNSFDVEVSETDSILITASEYYTPLDFLTNDLTTSSDGRLIESGGMVNVNAYYGDKRISLKEGKGFEISFPVNDSVKSEMQLFTGVESQDGMINWQVQEQESQSESSLLDQLEPPLTADTVVKYRECYLISTGYNYGYPGFLLNYDTLGQLFQLFEHFNKFYSNKFEIDEKYCEEAELQLRVHFILNDDYRIDSIRFDPKNETEEFNIAITKYLKRLPKLKYLDTANTYKQNSEYWESYPDRMKEKEYTMRFEAKRRISTKEFTREVKKMNSKERSKLNLETLNAYVFYSNKLGWINCDRFLNYQADQLATLEVQVQDVNNSTAYLVFKNINSILKGTRDGNKFVFDRIPKEEPVKLIAIESDSTKSLLAIRSLNRIESSVTLDNFQDFDISKLDIVLKN